MASFFAITAAQLLICYIRVLPSGYGVLYYMLYAALFLHPQPIPPGNTLSQLSILLLCQEHVPHREHMVRASTVTDPLTHNKNI
jgi:hypothetical protein